MGCINRIYRDLAGSPIPTLVRQKTLVRAARFFAPSHQLWVIIPWIIIGVMLLQGGAPPVISWAIIPLTIDISPPNQPKRYSTYLHQLS